MTAQTQGLSPIGQEADVGKTLEKLIDRLQKQWPEVVDGDDVVYAIVHGYTPPDELPLLPTADELEVLEKEHAEAEAKKLASRPMFDAWSQQHWDSAPPDAAWLGWQGAFDCMSIYGPPTSTAGR
jgi:hypothetical protein